MTVPEVEELMRYWANHPPAVERLAAMVSAYLGITWTEAPGSEAQSVTVEGGMSLAEMAAHFQRAGMA